MWLLTTAPQLYCLCDFITYEMRWRLCLQAKVLRKLKIHVSGRKTDDTVNQCKPISSTQQQRLLLLAHTPCTTTCKVVALGAGLSQRSDYECRLRLSRAKGEDETEKKEEEETQRIDFGLCKSQVPRELSKEREMKTVPVSMARVHTNILCISLASVALGSQLCNARPHSH